MQRFYYNEISRLNGVLQELNAVMEKYSTRDFDLVESLLQWLNNAIKVYKEQGYAEKESQLQSLKAEVVTAQRGYHPVSLEKVMVQRQEMKYTAVFKVLQCAEQQLRGDVAVGKERLEEAGNLVRQVIIAGIQNGMITQEMIGKIKTQADIEATWQALSKDANIALGQS